MDANCHYLQLRSSDLVNSTDYDDVIDTFAEYKLEENEYMECMLNWVWADADKSQISCESFIVLNSGSFN